MSDKVLDDSSQVLWELMNELYDVRTKWKLIGLGLLIPESDIDAISGTPQHCLQSLLSNWLKRLEPLPTWDRLVTVLKSPVLGEEKKAQQLEERFCDDPKTETNTPTHSGTSTSVGMLTRFYTLLYIIICILLSHCS